MNNITVDLHEIKYEIKIERGIIKNVGIHIGQIFKGRRVYIITDSNVEILYKDVVDKSIRDSGYETYIYVVEAGEESKNFKQLQAIYKFLAQNSASRKDLIVALGGGVIGDMAGLAAATYMRGIPFVQIPTSLLAQIDSSIGGKVAVNLPEGKNLVGAFYHPKLVLIDPECLKTLSKRVLADGAAEALKYGYIKDPEICNIFQKLQKIEDIYKYTDEIIYKCCEIKRVIVENDEKELGERMILNFGHTVGHAYESYFSYKKYTHGEAVALGMSVISRISENMGFAPIGTTAALIEILERLNLPYDIETAGADKDEIIKNIFHDKKANSEYINLILLKNIGEVFVEKIEVSKIKDFFKNGGF